MLSRMLIESEEIRRQRREEDSTILEQYRTDRSNDQRERCRITLVYVHCEA